MGGLAQADVIGNLQSQFSTTSNPNGNWSYGWEGVSQTSYQPNGTFAAYNASVSESYGTQLYSTSLPILPAALLIANSGPNGCCEDGTVALHPGANGEFSVVQWTAPITGTINVAGSFGAGDSGAMSYFVLSNGKVIASWLNDAAGESFGFSEAVTAGTTLDFAVGYNTALGNYYSGTTPVQAIISVPEPSFLLMLCAGLASVIGMVGAARRRSAV